MNLSFQGANDDERNGFKKTWFLKDLFLRLTVRYLHPGLVSLCRQLMAAAFQVLEWTVPTRRAQLASIPLRVKPAWRLVGRHYKTTRVAA